MTDRSPTQPHDPVDPTERPIHDDGLVHGVIFGLRRDDGRWLLIRRGRSLAAAPGMIAFPGGAVEIGESPRDAVIREAHEELGLHVNPIEQVWEHLFEERPLRLFGWLVEPQDWNIQPDKHEIDEVLWYHHAELTTGMKTDEDVLPRTDDFLSHLERSINRPKP